jgi:hypothetical protein
MTCARAHVELMDVANVAKSHHLFSIAAVFATRASSQAAPLP